MMFDKLPPPVGRDRPFPWPCIECHAQEVFPKATDYTTNVKHDGFTYTIRIPDLAIPTCHKCGDQTFAVGDDDRIRAALRAQLGLLKPEAIRDRRVELGLSQESLADQLGVTEETIVRWESGALIQSRAMDKLLRLYFDCAEARASLAAMHS